MRYELRELYLGKATNPRIALRDKNASPMDVEIQREAFLRSRGRSAEVPVSVSCRPLYAILPPIQDLFSVSCVTLPASNVTKITLKQRYCD